MDNVANSFNKFGGNLAKTKICDPVTSEQLKIRFIEKNPSSMFLTEMK